MGLKSCLKLRLVSLFIFLSLCAAIVSGCGGGGGGGGVVSIDENPGKLVKPNFSFALRFVSPEGRVVAAPALTTPGIVSVKLLDASNNVVFGPKETLYSAGSISISDAMVKEGTYSVSLTANLKMQAGDTFETVFQGSYSGAPVIGGQVTQVDVAIAQTGTTVPLTPAKLKFGTLATMSFNAGAPLTPAGTPLNVYVLDKYGDTLSNASGSLVLSWTQGGNEYDRTTGTVVNGVASFYELLAPNASGTIYGKAVFGSLQVLSPPLTISSSTPTAGGHIGFVTPPKSPVAPGTTWSNVAIAIRDSNGNIMSSAPVTTAYIEYIDYNTYLNSSNPSSLAWTRITSAQMTGGSATIPTVTVPNFNGRIFLRAYATGYVSMPTPVGIASPAPQAYQLQFASPPQTPVSPGGTWTSIGVRVNDSGGNLIDSNDQVVLSYTTPASNTPVTLATTYALLGIAAFQNIAVPPNVSGTIYLRASSGTLVAATANVTVGSVTPAAAKLAFSTPPQTPMAQGATWMSFAVAVQDASGATVTTASDTVVLTYTSASVPNPVTLATKAAVNGIATFSGVTVPTVSDGSITLRASSGSLTAATFNVSIFNSAFNAYVSTPQGIFCYNIAYDVSNPSAKVINTPVIAWELDYYGATGRQIKKMKSSAARDRLFITDDGNHFVMFTNLDTSSSGADHDLSGLPGPIINFAVSADNAYVYFLTSTMLLKYQLGSTTITPETSLNITGNPRNVIEYQPGKVFVAFDNKVTPVDFTGASPAAGTDLPIVGTPSGLDRDGLNSDIFVAEFTGNGVFRITGPSFDATSATNINLGSGRGSALASDSAFVRIVNGSGSKKVYVAKTGDSNLYSYDYNSYAAATITFSGAPNVILPSDMDISSNAYFLVLAHGDVNGFIRVVDAGLGSFMSDLVLKDGTGVQISNITGLAVR